MRKPAIGQKWVIHYKAKDGQPGMGVTDHFSTLPAIIFMLLSEDSTDIQITDKTIYKDDTDEQQERRDNIIDFQSRR